MNKIEEKIYGVVTETIDDREMLTTIIKKALNDEIEDEDLFYYSPIINKMNRFKKEVVDYLCDIAGEKGMSVFEFLAKECEDYDISNNNQFYKALNEAALKHAADKMPL